MKNDIRIRPLPFFVDKAMETFRQEQFLKFGFTPQICHDYLIQSLVCTPGNKVHLAKTSNPKNTNLTSKVLKETSEDKLFNFITCIKLSLLRLYFFYI